MTLQSTLRFVHTAKQTKRTNKQKEWKVKKQKELKKCVYSGMQSARVWCGAARRAPRTLYTKPNNNKNIIYSFHLVKVFFLPIFSLLLLLLWMLMVVLTGEKSRHHQTQDGAHRFRCHLVWFICRMKVREVFIRAQPSIFLPFVAISHTHTIFAFSFCLAVWVCVCVLCLFDSWKRWITKFIFASHHCLFNILKLILDFICGMWRPKIYACITFLEFVCLLHSQTHQTTQRTSCQFVFGEFSHSRTQLLNWMLRMMLHDRLQVNVSVNVRNKNWI